MRLMTKDSDFGPIVLGIECPQCGEKVQKTLRWPYADSDAACGCGQSIRLDAAELRATLSDTGKEVRAFEKVLGNFRFRL